MDERLSRGRRLTGNYRGVLAAAGTANLADGILWVAFPLLAATVTNSPAAVAGVTFLAGLPWLLFVLPIGALLDRADRRRMGITANLARGTCLAVVGVTIVGLAGDTPLLMIYAAALAVGLSETVADSSTEAILASVVPPGNRTRANGRLAALERVSNQFLGPSIAGFLVALTSGSEFLIAAACYLVAASLLARLRGSFSAPERIRESVWRDVVDGLTYLKDDRLLRVLAIASGFTTLASAAWGSVFVLYATDPGGLRLSEQSYGLLIGAAGMGGVMGSLATHRIEKRVGRIAILGLSRLGWAIFFASPIWVQHPLGLGAALVAGSALGSMWYVQTLSIRQVTVPDAFRARINSAFRLLNYGSIPLGAAVGAAVGESLGLQAVFATSATLTLILVGPVLVVSRQELERRVEVVRSLADVSSA